jgi:large subunit ribosomal protein L25
MAKEVPTIQAAARERIGSRYAKRLRATGRLPVVIYGHGSDPLSVHVDHKITLNALQKGLHVINLEIDGKAAETCLVKDLQFGHMGDDVIHMDLARVNLDEVVEVSISMEFYGSPEAAKKAGAIVVHVLNELSISCKVRDIPEHIRIDLGTMQGETLSAGDIKLPANTSLATAANAAVVRIQFAKEEAAATDATAAATPAAAAPAKKEEEKK